ncbi:MAG: hypothetical protein KBB54_03275 [Candidatus Pacebacteria bacterium]|jgi:hypothetical protein|nr:hypothetical protein [Candidatus Paceibacterota bacterium]
MTEENSEIQKIKEVQTTFRSKFQVLKDAKSSLLKLFRQKLEEKKIEEIKQNINSPQ